MELFSTELALRLRDARRGKRLSQATLAREAGCTQSAISMMELGRPDAVSRETLLKIAALLDMPLDQIAVAATGPTAPRPDVARKVCCPQAECPSNVPFAVGDSLSFAPGHQPDGHSGPYCGYCGEVLIDACPGCNAPLGSGGHCGLCGAAYVNQPAALATTAAAWAAERRRQLAEWRALL